MSQKVFVYDPTASDKLSSVRGIGRYLQILKENFPDWNFSSLVPSPQSLVPIFINPFFNFLQPPLTLKRIAQKQIAIIHDLIPLKYPSHFPPGIKGSIYILLNKLALKNYDLIITDSQASKKDIIDILRLPEGKIKVIYPCLPKKFVDAGIWKLGMEAGQENKSKKIERNPPSKFQLPNPLLSPSSSLCLYVGDATWNKNLVALARAIKIANVTCVFVGKIFQNVGNDPRVVPNQNDQVGHGGPTLRNKWLTEFQQFLRETQNDKRFIFAGFVPDSELIKLYERASFNILPSRDEGFGFSYLEAANFGCPSLLSDIPVLQEISDGKALFIDPINPQDIAGKINQINSDKNLRNKIGESAKKRSKYFSTEKFYEEFKRSVLVSEST
ncbi:MAG: glycosyltransferase, group 1 [uncultured bacterium]|nr:MAG: glycosyltransferase, group 1 [uncultured bacterium]